VAPRAGGIRDRFRTQMRSEIKQLALRQLAAGGPQALSVNAIAKELGVSGPALYRYFDSRDALLTELILDAYADLTAAMATGTDLRTLATAYRAWALAQPHRYRLLFAAPLPGYDAHDPRLVAAATEAMRVLLTVAGSREPGDDELDRQLQEWARGRGLSGVEPGHALDAIIGWSRLHGLISLEIGGNWASMGLDGDRLFAREVDALSSGR
jgi:AcrR family transcriptional regulator